MKHDIAELLPYYANGTLDAADRMRVEAELAACPSCSDELHELEQLGAALRERADAIAPLPPGILDDALARIGTSTSAALATRVYSAWWSTPVRYATAAVLVVGIGAGAFAAYHAHLADVATKGDGPAVVADNMSVYRVSPGPRSAGASQMKAANHDRFAAGAPVPQSETAVAKQHRLAKTGHIEIIVPGVEASIVRVRAMTRDNNGELTALDDANPRTAGAVHGAQMTIEVPAARLDGTLDALATLGTVQNRAINAEDVDASIVDEEARLRNLRREETDLRTLMDKGGKVEEILAVQEQLSDVRGQIEQLDAQHQHDVHRVATSTITVELTEERANAGSAQPGPTSRIDGAWQSGINALADAVISLLSAIVWCVAYSPLPLGIIALAYAATRMIRKRRTASTSG
jgi:hypothetical protein